MDERTSIGRQGEELAVRHLEESGYEVLDRNWRCDLGEIDVVAREGDVLVFCEVKTRSGLGFGTPLEGVTREKAARLRRLAGRWLTDHGRGHGRGRDIRIDVIGVLWQKSAPAAIEHVRGAE